MIFLRQVLPVIATGLVGVYFYFFLKRMLSVFGMQEERRYVRSGAAVLAFFFVVPVLNIWGLWAVVVLYTAAFALLVDLIHLAGRREGWKGERWKKIYRSGCLPVLMTVFVLGYGWWNMHHVIETDVTVYTEKMIREEGYRVCMISDLHYGLTMDGERLEAYCGEIEEKEPDLVLLCGDIVDEHTTKEEMEEVFPILAGIEAEYGVYYIYGNHDRGRYSTETDFLEEDLSDTLTNCGIHVLTDETARINGELTLIGRDDRTHPVGFGRRTVEELLEGVDREDFLLLLDHQPRELEENGTLGIDLQLSGHTHGGQMWPVGLISDVLGFGEMNYGYRDIDGFQIFVTSGMAGWSYPFRTGKHSEYVILNIQNQ